jgi:hypothetical protein
MATEARVAQREVLAGAVLDVHQRAAGPIYQVDGRSFKTVRGLGDYLLKKHGATGHSMVGADRRLRIFKDRNTVVATYSVGAPVLGEPMKLTVVTS